MAEIRVNATGELKLYDSDDSNYVSFKSAGTVSSNVAWVLPSADGSSGQALTTDGSGTLSWATASSADPSSADGDSLGTASAEWSDLYLADGGIIYFGNDQEITLTHVADDGLVLKHVGTGDGKEPSLTFQAGDNDIAANDVLGSIFFQAPDEGAGTDAILVAAGIEAVSEGDFSSSNNATKLSFKTAASEAASEKMSLSSGGNLAVSGTVTTSKVIGDGDTDSFLEFAGSDVVNLSAGGGDTALRIDANKDILMFGPGDLHAYDDHGIIFGDGNDFALGANAGETEFVMSKGGTTTGGTTGKWTFIPTTDGVYVDLFGTEGKGPAHGLYQDDGDDNDDLWRYGQGASDGDANGIIAWAHYGTGSWTHKMRIYTTGNFATSGTHAASQSFDYAEFWEWKTELANDDKITETYGMTVVLDGDKVRLAEAGEEAKVLGVVRPNNTSTMVGGGQELEYKDKYEKNVWGETQYEEYTQVTWEDTYNDVTVKHSYMKDRIPAKRIRHGAVKSQENWHTLESNFEKDKDGNTIDLVVPSTSSQKTAANYVERTTYGKDKGEHKAGDKLMRPKLNSSYDFTKSKSYQGRDKRRKEWCVVGLLGQVEVRDSAVIPTSWTKMKNLESGIDLYYIK